MRKKVFFVFVVWVMFLSPFLILSLHFKNSIKSIALTAALYRVDMLNSSISSYAASILENEYNLFFGFDKKPSSDDVIRFLSSRKGSILRGFAIYNEGLTRIHSSDFPNSDSYREILKTLKKVDIPVGVVDYPDDKPADLILGKKVGSLYVLYRTDLGYLISKLMQRITKSDGVFYIVDSDFNIIYDSSYNYLIDRTSFPKEIEDLIKGMVSRSSFSYRGVVKIGNSDLLISIYNIENTKWWSIWVLDTSDVKDENLSVWAKNVILAGVVLIFIFSWVVLILSKKLLKE